MSIQGALSPLIHLYEERRGAHGGVDLLVNWRIYQDELTLLDTLLLEVSVATLEALLDFLRTLSLDEITPIRLTALNGLRSNLAKQVLGLLTMINCDAIRDDNRQRSSAALRRNADALDRYLEPAALKSLREAAIKLAAGLAHNEAIRGDLEAFGRFLRL